MDNSIGKKIAFYRKQKGMTQEEIAEKLNVTPQAVSKWENDIACPDIMQLAPLAKLFGVSTDELLMNETVSGTRFVPEAERKSIDQLMLKVLVNSKEGDKVRINLPVPLIKIGLEIGMKMPQISGNAQLKDIDFAQIISLVEKGVIGNLVEVESAEGDIVNIVVE